MFGFFGKKLYTDLSAEEFRKMLKERDDVVLIDARTDAEIAEVAIPGHIQIDVSHPHFQEKLEKLDKDKTYLVYCRSGARSASLANFMGQLGFRHVYNLAGGIIAWLQKFPDEVESKMR